MTSRYALLVACMLLPWPGVLASNTDAATESLMKKSNCFKCHSVDKKKDGPSFKEVAAKYQDKADATQTLFTHLTTNPMVDVDGNKEEHESLKSKKDEDVNNVIRWILSR
jgi:cytochrome c